MSKIYATKSELANEYGVNTSFMDKMLAHADKMVGVLKDFGYNPKVSYLLVINQDEDDDCSWVNIHPIIKDKGICMDVLDAQFEIGRLDKDENGKWYWKTYKYNEETEDWDDAKDYNFIPNGCEMGNSFDFRRLNPKQCMSFLYETDWLFQVEDWDEPYYVAFHPDYCPTHFPRIAMTVDKNALDFLERRNFNFFELKIIK